MLKQELHARQTQPRDEPVSREDLKNPAKPPSRKSSGSKRDIVARLPQDAAARDFDKQLEKALKETADKERDNLALRDKVKAQEKTIEDLKKNLTIHVDKKVTKNTTTTESHVN